MPCVVVINQIQTSLNNQGIKIVISGKYLYCKLSVETLAHENKTFVKRLDDHKRAKQHILRMPRIACVQAMVG